MARDHPQMPANVAAARGGADAIRCLAVPSDGFGRFPVGDGKSSGAAHQVDPFDLTRAARDVRKVARDLRKDTSTFKAGMSNYSMATIDKVTEERGKRIKGEDYDKSIAEKEGLQHAGATSDWLNPFGRFNEADRLQSHVDDAHLAAIEDGKDLADALDRLAGALFAAAKMYEQNEGRNSAISKKIMQQLLAGPNTKE
jgi:hypothetical protein